MSNVSRAPLFYDGKGNPLPVTHESQSATEWDEKFFEILENLETGMDYQSEVEADGKTFTAWPSDPAKMARFRGQLIIEASRQATKLEAARILGETIAEAIHKAENHEKQMYVQVYAPNIEKRLEDLAGSVGSIGTSTEGLSIADSLDILGTTLQELGENLSIREETKSAKPRAPRKSQTEVIEKARKRLGVEPAVPAPSSEVDDDDKSDKDG